MTRVKPIKISAEAPLLALEAQRNELYNLTTYLLNFFTSNLPNIHTQKQLILNNACIHIHIRRGAPYQFLVGAKLWLKAKFGE